MRPCKRASVQACKRGSVRVWDVESSRVGQKTGATAKMTKPLSHARIERSLQNVVRWAWGHFG